MSKYANTYKAVYGVFDSVDWKAKGINTRPINFSNNEGLDTFIRIDVITSTSKTEAFPNSVGGVILIEIFIPKGNGNREAITIADALDTFIAGTSINGVGTLQTGASTLVSTGEDPKNKSLARFKYTVPFNYYGV